MKRMKRMKHVKRVSEYIGESEMIRRRAPEGRVGRVSVRQKPESRTKRLIQGKQLCKVTLCCDSWLDETVPREGGRLESEIRTKRVSGGCRRCGQSGDVMCGVLRGERCGDYGGERTRGNGGQRGKESEKGKLCGTKGGTEMCRQGQTDVQEDRDLPGRDGRRGEDVLLCGNGGQCGKESEKGKLCGTKGGTEMCRQGQTDVQEDRDLPCCGGRQGEGVLCGDGGQVAVQANPEDDMKDDLEEFAAHLRYEGRKESTIKKYLRDLKAFRMWLGDEAMTREKAREWRDFLCEKGYAPVTVNSMLASLNLFFRFCGREECCVKALRLQHRFFRNSERELAQGEYERLVETARRQGKERLALLIETMCATGVRVSEVRAFTVESVRRGRADISLKGKIRTILIPGRLRKKLMRYIRKKKIASGEVFVTRSGKGLTRQQIWAEMKRLCSRAGVLRTKVFPHNLRHLFARTFYRVSRDIAKLADVLGHSHIGTTRLYLTSTGAEHARHLERLNLVSRK